MFPNSGGAAVYEDYRGYPSLRAVDFRPVLHGHEVLLLLMAEQKRIEVRQKADQWAFELGLRQFIEILPKDCRGPALNVDRREAGLLARLDLARIRERYAAPHCKVRGCCRTKSPQVPAQEDSFCLFPRYILPSREPCIGPHESRRVATIGSIADDPAGGREMKEVHDRER